MTTAEVSRQEIRSSLPDGWRWVRLREVLEEASPGFACGERDPGGVIQLRMNNVDTHGNINWDEFIRVPFDADTLVKYQLQSGDVLFNNTNSVELVGKTAVFLNHSEPVVYSNHFTRLRTVPDYLFSNYLALWLVGQWQQGTFAYICNRWIGQSAVKNDKLLSLAIPLPPLSEQKRIAAILNEQMAAVERARAATEAQLDAAKALPAAYVRVVFTSPKAQHWSKRRLGDIAKMLPSKSIATDGDTEVKAITTACLDESGFQPSGVKLARMRASDAAECVVSPGEILIARSNTPELVGRVAMFSGNPRGAVASDLTIRLWVNGNTDAPFLTAYLSFLYLSGYWKERAGGASGSMKKITRTQIQDEQVPVPSLLEQQRIAANLSKEIASAAKTRKVLQEQLDTVEKLHLALLRQAFAGKL